MLAMDHFIITSIWEEWRLGHGEMTMKFLTRTLMKGKTELIDAAFRDNESISSFADLGGIWGVDGGYTFYTLNKYNIKDAYLFDNQISQTTFSRSKEYSQLKLHEQNFGSDGAAGQFSHVDLILLFDVLLHQVNPNWDEILAKYAPKTDYFAVYNPQFEGEKIVRLLDLGKEEYFRQVPHKPMDYYHYSLLFTDREREVRDSPDVWQWGITDADLREVLKELGFKEIYSSIGSRWGRSRFTSKGFLFKKMSTATLPRDSTEKERV